MPGRSIPLVTNQIYHIFNRGIDHRPTFTDKRERQRAILAIKLYRFTFPPMRLSRILATSKQEREGILSDLMKNGKPLVEFFSFCLMPNHFHFLLRQVFDGGISRFVGNFQNSYTRYFNTKHERVGPLFMDQFKAVRIETDEQLLHVSRYIHLNPYSSFVVKSPADLVNYRWSSLPEYLEEDSGGICSKEMIFLSFKNTQSYRNFIFDQTDYQRELEKMKHLAIDLP